MSPSTSKDCVIVDRGGVVENVHKVHAVVVDSTGGLLYSVGNASRLTLARSAAKPGQAVAVLETGGFTSSGFDEADLALICASHSSEEKHIARARSMLVKTGFEESDMRCGGHPAVSATVNRKWIREDFKPTPLYNNCSGKHIGMLAGARALGANIADYHQLDHPMQLRVKDVFEELSGLDKSAITWTIDGCNLPAPALPLDALARSFEKLATAVDEPHSDQLLSTRQKNLARVFRAMTQHPELVAGQERFCTVLMQAFQGELVGKVGADGCYGIGVRASEQTRRIGAVGAIGVSVKVEDGNLDILYSAVSEILEQLQIGTTEMRRQLKDFHRYERFNTAGVMVGNVIPVVKLQAHGADFRS